MQAEIEREAPAAEAQEPWRGFFSEAISFLATASLEEAELLYGEMLRMPGVDDRMIAALGREDLFFLLAHVLRRPDVAHPWVYERCREVECSPNGHLDLWSRFHFKSTIITFGLTVQDILRDPEVTAVIFSHNRPGAKSFLRQIKTEFEANTLLKALYPDVLWKNPQADSPKWSEDEGIVVRRQSNPKEATLEAWGLVDGMPTGKHYKLRVYDDIVTENAISAAMTEKTTRAVELSYALGTEDGIERFIGTRYHFNDTYKTLIDRKSVRVRLHDGTQGNSGDINRPVYWSRDFMAQMRRKMGPNVFSSQILQNPRADATHGFHREWLEFWTPDDARNLNVVILRDAANSKKASADYTVDWVVGLGSDENLYVLAVYRDRLNLTERTKQLFDLHRKWRPVEVRYEEYGLQSDIEHVQNEMLSQKYRFRVVKVGGKLRKEERIKRLIPFFERKRVLLPRTFYVTTLERETKDLIHEFVENEYMAFPVSVHDDMLDSLSRICETDGYVGDEKVRLSLAWPSKARHRVQAIQRYLPSDAGMGI